jgi:soluble lytic murein transglycosylase
MLNIKNNLYFKILLVFVFYCNFAISNTIQILNKHYSKNQYSKYFEAKNAINTNPDLALNFIKNNENSYLKNDLIREILKYDMNNNFYIDYQEKFKLLYNTKITENESCGYDYSKLILNHSYILKNDYNLYYAKNAKWCSKLTNLQAEKSQISKQQLKFFIFNLIINSDTNIINEVFGADILKNKTTEYYLLNKIKAVAKNSPNIAYDIFATKNIESDSRNYIANYIATLYAKNQDFKMAQILFEKYSINTYNYSIIEWKAKTFLANLEWQKLINYINNDMPETIKNKQSWLYWLGIAYKKIGDDKFFQHYLKKIPNNYGYYSLLAKGELEESINFIKSLPPIIKFNDIALEKNILDLIDLYQLGINKNNSDIRTVATFEWYYLTRIVNYQTLLNMASTAKNNGLWELCIIAGSRLVPNYLYLSYPEVYLTIYQKYASIYNIDVSYLLAITRQESRFRNFIIAFDGGIGLMQIMPNTAKYIMKKAKIRTCKILDIDCNIKLGSWYLSNLYKKFGNIIYATSSYNAGPNRSFIWQNKLNNLDRTIQIELIPIQITRDYVQNVLVNKAIYEYRMNNNKAFNFVSYINKLKIIDSNLNYLNDDNTDKDKMK